MSQFCPKHGEHEATMNISIPHVTVDATYCLICMTEKFDELGIRRMHNASTDEVTK